MNRSNEMDTNSISLSESHMAIYWSNDRDSFFEVENFNQLAPSSYNISNVFNNTDQSVILTDDATTSDQNKLDNNFNFETEPYDMELDLSWFETLPKLNHLDSFSDDKAETIDISDSTDNSVSLPGFSSLSKVDKNRTVVGNAYNDLNSFFANINKNDLNIHIESDDHENEKYIARNFIRENDTLPGEEEMSNTFDNKNNTVKKTFNMENDTADLLDKTLDLQCHTEANLLNQTFDMGSDTEAEPLNRTFDILNIEDMESNLALEDEGLNKNIEGNENSTLENVVDFLKNRENEDIGSAITYVIKSKSDGSIEVEIDCGLATDIAHAEMINQNAPINECNGSNVGFDSESESDFSSETESDSSVSDPGNFVIMPLGSNNYRDNKSYLYTKNNFRKGRLYLRCKHSIKHACKARVTVRDNNFQQALMTIKHNHPHDTGILDKSIFDKKLEENIRLDPFETPRQLYLKTKKDLLNKIDPTNIPPLKKKEGFIYRRQKRYIPLLPSTIEEFETFVSDEKYRNCFSKDHRDLPYYRGVWSSVKGERNLVYISETILKLINKTGNTEFFIDGTFKALPHHLQFRQLYVINVIFKNQCYPLAYIFMEKKTFTSYDCIFENLKFLMPLVEVTKVMSDYEAATRKALKKHYPNARISGCFFHYVQAIVKSTKRFGLKSDEKFKDAIKKLCMLALLPNDFVLKGFKSIDNKFKKKSKRWASFKKYWLKQWEPANISVYGLVNRSNNFSESNNKSLNLLLKRRHPNIWILIMSLKLLEMDKSCLIERADKGEMATTKRNRDMVRLNAKIEQATKLFEEDEDVEMFLERVTFEENVELFVKDQVNIMSDDDGSADDGFEDDSDEEVIPNHYNVESDFRKNHPRKAAMPKTAEKPNPVTTDE